MHPARPTLRCLEEDLGEKLPPLGTPLHAVQHPLVVKARSQFAVARDHERILELDDRIWWKVKILRWRGAVHIEQAQPWLGAAGWRESGSQDDFYVDLGNRCERSRKAHNLANTSALTTNTATDWMLPNVKDRKRLFAEGKTAAAQEYRSVIPELVREAITTRQEQQADVSGYSVSVTVGGDPADSAYIGIAIVGSVESADHAVILKQVPGTDPSAWFVDRMPHRDAKAGEVVWSNFLEAD